MLKRCILLFILVNLSFNVNFCIKGKDLSLFSAAEQARIELLKDLDDEDNFSGDADIEGVKYINIHVDKKTDPLMWWRNNSEYFPRLAKLAQIFISIPASSASSECSFILCQRPIVCEQFAIGTVRELNKKCFIKENFDLIKEKVVQKFGLERKV
jgi:hypothetical protein